MHIFDSDNTSQLIVSYDYEPASDWDDPVQVLLRREAEAEHEEQIKKLRAVIRQAKVHKLPWYKKL